MTSEEIAQLEKVNLELVSISACLTSYMDMAQAFTERGAKRYLAPKTKVPWVDAALFFTLFYKRYLYDRKSFEASFNYARENTKTGQHFKEYWYP